MKILHRVFSVTLVTLCVLGVIFMVSYTFNTHSFLTKIDYELNASETAYTVKGIDFQGSKHVVIPEEHNGKPVTAIADAKDRGGYGGELRLRCEEYPGGHRPQSGAVPF